MRRNTLAILAACAAVTICGQAQAQQPAAAPATRGPRRRCLTRCRSISRTEIRSPPIAPRMS